MNKLSEEAESQQKADNEKMYREAALKKQIEEALAQQHGEYLTVIRLDGKA